MRRATALIVLMALGLGGCTNYYRVTDLTTQRVYYSNDVKQDHGATVLKDGRTGSQVTIQNSEVKKITQEEYETARGHAYPY